MSFEVHITKIATGETRVLKRPEAWDPEHSDYMWSEGNYSCDCNRSIFFEEAGNVAYDDVDEAPCGDTAYRIKIVSDGKTVYDEPGC